MNYVVLAALGVATGGLAVLQSALNGRLAASVGSSLLAVTYTSVVTLLFLLGAVVALRIPLVYSGPNPPAWVWFAGVAGGLFLLGTTFLIPRIGAANLVVLLVAGQILMALLFDQYGLLGIPVTQVTLQRVFASGLLLVAVFLMR